MIVAGEASGDLHGAEVVKAILRLQPQIPIMAMGSERMARAGASLIIDSSKLSVVGITEVFGKIGKLLKAYRELKKIINKKSISLLILIDFPDFNLLLAKAANRAGVPVLYYISPQVWAWRAGRAQKIARLVQKMAVIFPFEVPLYQKAGLEAEFVGHPLLDIFARHREDIAGSANIEIKGDPLIALLPGSREKELRSLLPEMIRAARIIKEHKPGASFILPAAPTLSVDEIDKILRPDSVSISVVAGQTYQAIMACDLAIVASGTATLETAILGKPMVIVYQLSPLSYWVGKAMVRVKWIGLVNIVAGKSIVPELVQREARGERIAAEALRILEDDVCRRKMIEERAEVKRKLGVPGAAERVAHMALAMIVEGPSVSKHLTAN